MPRYLRWAAAVTAGIVIQFALQVIILAVAVGGDADQEVTLNGATGALITFGAAMANVIAALAVNDWLRSRYPAGAARTPGGGADGDRSG